jgi:hypothetical protein
VTRRDEVERKVAVIVNAVRWEGLHTDDAVKRIMEIMSDAMVQFAMSVSESGEERFFYGEN